MMINILSGKIKFLLILDEFFVKLLVRDYLANMSTDVYRIYL